MESKNILTLPVMLLGWVTENHTYGMERNFTDRIETTFPQLLGVTTMTCGLYWNLLVMQSPLKPREVGEYSGSPDLGLTGWELSWGCTFMMRKTNMGYKELIDILQDESNPNVLDYIEDVAIAIKELLAENQALRNAANGFKKQLESAEARVEKAERERDAAIKILRKIEWCNGCKNFRGLQGCRIGALVTCNPQNDMYVFGEGEE